MTIGLLQVELLLPEPRSLKDKRSLLRRLKNRIRKNFNISLAELKYGDQWGRSLIGIITINGDRKVVHRILEDVERFVEHQNGIQIIERRIEMF